MISNVSDLDPRINQLVKEAVERRPGGGDNGGMDDSLRADVATLKTDVEVIKSNYATRHDVVQSEATIIKWMVGIGLVLGTVVIGYLNFSKPPSPPASVQPIIIQVPSPALPPPQKN